MDGAQPGSVVAGDVAMASRLLGRAARWMDGELVARSLACQSFTYHMLQKRIRIALSVIMIKVNVFVLITF